MYNVYVIFTRHKVSGNCNSIELYRIIEKIRPEIIFEELSYSNFNKAYKEKSLITVETNAIKKYLHNHNIEHIPVDTYNIPNNYYESLDYMLDRIINSNLIESREIRKILDNQSLWIIQEGFNFLNSNQNDQIFEEFNTLKEKIINTLNNKDLFHIASLEKEVIQKREIEIIDNIYNFSKKNIYNQAILFIGSGHRKSIREKIEKCKTQEKIEINWIINDT